MRGLPRWQVRASWGEWDVSPLLEEMVTVPAQQHITTTQVVLDTLGRHTQLTYLPMRLTKVGMCAYPGRYVHTYVHAYCWG